MTIEDLIKDLASAEEKERAFAAEDIGYEGAVEGIGPLVELLQIEPSRYVREVIVTSLKMMKGTELVSAIIPLLRSDDAFIRNGAVDILALQDEGDIVPLKELLEDSNKDVRKFALDVLVLLQNRYCADLIASALDDPEINNVITAVEYLGRLEISDHIHKINQLFMTADNRLLRCTCLEVMALLGDEESVADVSATYPTYQSINDLEQYSYLKFVANKGSELHLPLIVTLIQEKGELMAKETINAIQGILSRGGWNLLPRYLIESLFEYIDAAINDINKYELLILIGKYQNEGVYSRLLKYLTPENKLVCLGAVEGLGLHGRTEAIPLLTALKMQVKDEDLVEAIEKSVEMLGN